MPRSETMETLQVPYELDEMRWLYIDRRPKRVLEIGCWDGGTIREWLTHGVDDLFLAAVDLEHRNSDAYDEWRKPGQKIVLHTGSSFEDPAKQFIADNGPYDWALIDGDHGDFGVRNDWNAVRPHMAEGGLVLLHDITPPHGNWSYPPGVLLEELSKTYETWKYQDLTPAPWARGIGVVQL